MGNICNCMKLQPESSGDNTPLIVRGDVELKSNQGENERGAKYYQAVIDDAHKLVKNLQRTSVSACHDVHL